MSRSAAAVISTRYLLVTAEFIQECFRGSDSTFRDIGLGFAQQARQVKGLESTLETDGVQNDHIRLPVGRDDHRPTRFTNLFQYFQWTGLEFLNRLHILSQADRHRGFSFVQSL